MQPISVIYKPFRFFIFGIFIFLFAGCNNDPANTKSETNNEAAAGLQADAVLHQRLQAVLDADSAYAQLVTTTASTADLDAKNETIAEAEIALQKTLDSLQQLPAQKGAATTSSLAPIINNFKNILDSRRALSDLRMVVSANSDDSTSMQHTLVQLRNELQEKTKRIAALEQTSNTGTQVRPEVIQNAPPDTETITNAPARGESLADLRQRNKNLTLALNNMQQKYFVLGRDYLVLKQTQERTQKELEALRKQNSPK